MVVNNSLIFLHLKIYNLSLNKIYYTASLSIAFSLTFIFFNTFITNKYMYFQISIQHSNLYVLDIPANLGNLVCNKWRT